MLPLPPAPCPLPRPWPFGPPFLHRSAARAAQEQLGDQSDELEQLKRQILLLGGLEHLQHLQQQQQHPPLTAGGYGGLSFGGPQQQQARLQHPSLALFGLPTGEGEEALLSCLRRPSSCMPVCRLSVCCGAAQPAHALHRA